jgi:hypothetical protein
MLFQWLEPLLDTIVDECLLHFKLLVSKKVIEIEFFMFCSSPCSASLISLALLVLSLALSSLWLLVDVLALLVGCLLVCLFACLLLVWLKVN